MTLFGTRERRFRLEEVGVWCVQRSFFVWGAVAVGLIGAACVGRWPGSAGAWGWVYLWALFVTIVAILVDISTGKLCVWGGGLFLVWLASKYVEDVKRIPVLSPLFHAIGTLDP